MSDVIDDFFQENEAARSLGPKAVLTQLITMSIISSITVIAFNILRPRNKIVYEPKVKYHVGTKQPPRINDSLFGWVSPLIHTKEAELVEKIGLDAVTFLRFLRMLRWLFTAIALVSAAVLIPVDLIYNLRKVKASDRDALSMFTIRDVRGPLLFAHVAVLYVITFLIMGFVWYNWREMVRLRHDWFRSPEYMQSFYARTLLILHVPKKLHTDEGIKAIFESVNVPYPTTAVHIGRRVGKLPELVECHNDTVRELEQYLVRYLKNGNIAKKRPMITQGGFLGIGGTKLDAIDFYTKRLQKAEAAINEYRQEIDTRKPENYGFASMAAVPYAHIVARLLQNKKPKGTTISLAPNPKDIIWENLTKSDAALAQKRTTGWALLFVVCFFNTIPVLLVAFLANLASLTNYVHFLASWAQSSHATFTAVSGILPSAISAFFGFFLPLAMRWLSKYQGAITHSRLDRAVVARYFAFLMISQLIIFTLIGVIFGSVSSIVQEIGQHKSFRDIINALDTLPAKINSTYINQANYWLTFFPLRGFLTFFDLAQVLNLVWIWVKKGLWGRTPREIREWTQPPDFEYAVYYSNILFMVAVGFVFAPLAPLVVIAAAVVFWFTSFVQKYQLMFVFVSKVETGGRLWNVVINRLLVTVVFMQALMVLTIGLQRGFKSLEWISTVPPILFIVVFKVYLNRTFMDRFRYYNPTQEEIAMATRNAQTEVQDTRKNRIENRFGHPALHAELFTPMLHADMMRLLPNVYHGRLQTESTKLQEYGGQKTEAQVLPGGIKIAGITQNDLEYDPALYRRDRGELDWDARSIATTHLMGGPGSLHHQKTGFYAASHGRASPAPSAYYDKYQPMNPNNDIEMSRFDGSADQLPLLTRQQTDYFDNAAYNQHQHLHVQPYNHGGAAQPSNLSLTSLPSYASPTERSPSPLIPPVPSLSPQWQQSNEAYREAPLHRPPPSRQGSSWSDAPYQPQQQSHQSPEGGNMAGRGAWRGATR